MTYDARMAIRMAALERDVSMLKDMYGEVLGAVNQLGEKHNNPVKKIAPHRQF
jgi:hypothetical protein